MTPIISFNWERDKDSNYLKTGSQEGGKMSDGHVIIIKKVKEFFTDFQGHNKGSNENIINCVKKNTRFVAAI